MTPEWLSREVSLIGEEAVEKLQKSSVLVFGAGGVGSYTLEALARAGVGKITIVDHDKITPGNINRQLIATHETIGGVKAELAATRLRAINPEANIIPLAVFAKEDNIEAIIKDASPDYVIDAIDNVTAKLLIIEISKKLDISVISCMGTGNRLNASYFKISDISKTSVCPLARVIRRELRLRGIKHCDVLYSDEQPVKTGLRTPSSISFVPPVAGMLIAGHCIRGLIQ